MGSEMDLYLKYIGYDVGYKYGTKDEFQLGRLLRSDVGFED